MVASKLDFKGFPSDSSTPDHLRSVVLAFSEDRLRQLLAFITASAALPRENERNREGTIQIQRKVGAGQEALPMAHTCFNRLDLPDYGDIEVLRSQIIFCLDHLEMAGFGEA